MNRLAVSMLVMDTLLIPNLPAMAVRKDAAQNSQVQVQAETQLACMRAERIIIGKQTIELR
jgi:hypothetical protein